MPNEKKPKPPSVKSRRELAEKFAVSLKTIDSWVYDWKKIKECPCVVGNYDLNWIANWLCSRKRTPKKVKKVAMEILGREFKDTESDGNGQGTVDVVYKLREAQLRKEQAAAEAIEIKNQSMRADVVPNEVVQQCFSLLFTQIRALFTQLPAEMEASFPAKARRELSNELKQRVEHKLEGIHSYVTEVEHDIANHSST